MARKSPRNTRTILYLLGIYIILQFVWWAYLLIEGNQERLGMVIGEGVIFLFLLLFGMYRLKRSFDREIALAEQERNFMMAVTHELRSPITSIKLFLQTLRRMNQGDDEQERMADRAIMEADRLNGLVDNILLASRIESDAFTLSLQEKAIGEEVRSILETPSRTIGSSHETSFDIEEGIRAFVDSDALSSVLINLYENAVKYSPEGSKIQVRVDGLDDKARIRISDEGEGIPDAEKEKVLDKFYRAGEESKRESKGTGLGLYIVHRLTEMQKGSFQLKDSDGGGVEAVLLFPKA